MLDFRIKARRGDFVLDTEFLTPTGVTALFGGSGAGKTSVVNAIAGLLQPAEGRIAVGDTVLFDSALGVNVPLHRRRVGFVFQNARLFPHLSVHQNLRYGGSHDEERVISILGLADMLARRPKTLSGGEQQRVALGRALMCDPQILLMDEPLAALDAPRKAEIMPYLETLRDSVKVPIVYVSHTMSEVARLATTLVVMQAGKVLRAGPIDDVLADPAAVPLIGVQDAGALIHARVISHDPKDGLTLLRFDGGDLLLPGAVGQIGQTLRLRVAAGDVILSRAAPEGISALNVLPVTITQLSQGRGPGVAVGLMAGKTRLLARVTRRSATALDLSEGQQLFAIIKANAVAPADVGG